MTLSHERSEWIPPKVLSESLAEEAVTDFWTLSSCVAFHFAFMRELAENPQPSHFPGSQPV